eukprot:TRINITY_DN6063_c0_g1_i1.p1 TRINITY_DN6063_c0_g1~~TRINITY_DN6063_c0_g1_i1.p1  ORF type:complete len:100 (+),score=46.88 TRINITY_DN6063_c0_g1_i1:3-302(+)
MIRPPPRPTQGVSSAAQDVYKRQEYMGLIEQYSAIMGNCFNEGICDNNFGIKIKSSTWARDSHGLYDYETQNTSLTEICLLYTSPSPRDLSTSRMPSSA